MLCVQLLNSKIFSSSMLKPQPPAKPSIDLLAQAPTMDNNRLEKLVKNFVVEDKARLAARNKTMPSSIQYALQKFERNSQGGDPTFVKKTNAPSTPTRTNSYNSSPISSPSSPSLVSEKIIFNWLCCFHFNLLHSLWKL